MYSSLKLFFPRLTSLISRPTRALDLPSLPTHNVETDPERRARTLKHLLKANHANNAIFHGTNLSEANAVPNILCAAYLLNSTAEELTTFYETLSRGLDPWPDIHGGVEDDVWRDTEIGQEEWKEYLGKRHQQRAFVDFYEDRMVAEGYEWKQLVNHYLYEGDAPLAYSLVAGSGNALIRLATAYQFNFRDLGIEALAMASCLYSPDLASKSIASQYSVPTGRSTSILSILAGFRNDTRLKSEALRETVIGEHLDKWTFACASEDSPHSTQDLANALKEAHIVSVLHELSCIDRMNLEEPATLGTTDPLTPLVFSAALRTILPQAPAGFAVPLLRQWLYLMMLTYLDIEFPDIYGKAEWNASTHDNESHSWKAVVYLSKQGVTQSDAAQTVLALQTAAETWGDDVDLKAVFGERYSESQLDGRNFWLKAAYTMVHDIAQVDVRHS